MHEIVLNRQTSSRGKFCTTTEHLAFSPLATKGYKNPYTQPSLLLLKINQLFAAFVNIILQLFFGLWPPLLENYREQKNVKRIYWREIYVILKFTFAVLCFCPDKQVRYKIKDLRGIVHDIGAPMLAHISYKNPCLRNVDA